MPTPSENSPHLWKFCASYSSGGMTAIRSEALSRTYRERLVKNGFFQEILKGWYIPAKPETPAGESTAWNASFWDFCAGYLLHRFGEAWCLSPEQSLSFGIRKRMKRP